MTIDRSNLLVGSALALFSAATFALNMVLAGMSYEHGANIHALNIARSTLFLIVLIVIILSTRTSVKLPTNALRLSIIIGLLLCAEMYVLLAAIQTIAVALAVLIFYMYPLIIAIYRWVTGEEPFSFLSISLLLVGLGGLVFVLINAPVSIDTAGLVFSLLAALLMAAMLITGDRNMKNHKNEVVLFYALSTVVLLVAALSILHVDLHWPKDNMGWVVFSGSSIFYVAATFTLFKAVSLVGPLRTAIIDTTAPVWAILFGFMLLGQSLTLQQMLGAVVVVVSAMLLQYYKRQ